MDRERVSKILILHGLHCLSNNLAVLFWCICAQWSTDDEVDHTLDGPRDSITNMEMKIGTGLRWSNWLEFGGL